MKGMVSEKRSRGKPRQREERRNICLVRSTMTTASSVAEDRYPQSFGQIRPEEDALRRRLLPREGIRMLRTDVVGTCDQSHRALGLYITNSHRTIENIRKRLPSTSYERHLRGYIRCCCYRSGVL